MRYVSYLRLSKPSKAKRARVNDGLGIDAQRASVANYIGNDTLLAEFVETETGKDDDRPQLLKAIERCRLTGAKLIIAKLDRLSRNASFLFQLRDLGLDIEALDIPNANTFTFGVMALLAQQEREMISARTKAALDVLRSQGVKLGGFRGYIPPTNMGAAGARKAADSFAAQVCPMIAEMRATTPLREIAARLNADGIRCSRGGKWSATTVARVLARV